MAVKVTRRAFINKNTKQMTVTIPKKEFKKIDPTIKFSDNLLVDISIRKRRRR